MSARIEELEIVNVGEEQWFEFTWTGDAYEWQEALRTIKVWIPAEARSFDAETKRWRVRADYAPALGRIFGNFEAALDAARSQLSLFGTEGG